MPFSAIRSSLLRPDLRDHLRLCAVRVVGAFGPLIAALIVAPLTRGRAGLKELGLRIIRWRVRWYWYVVAIGLPLAIHWLTVLLNLAAGVDIPRQGFTSIAGWLLIFGVRLINPHDGPIGEEPGWRGFALPGLQATRSPLVSTAILAVLVTIWHLPLFYLVYLEEGSFPPSTIVGGVVGPFAFTFMATWLFQPHERQRADDDSVACLGRKCPGRGMGVHGAICDRRDRFGDLRLEVVA